MRYLPDEAARALHRCGIQTNVTASPTMSIQYLPQKAPRALDRCGIPPKVTVGPILDRDTVRLTAAARN
jgi:hypothetical protein